MGISANGDDDKENVRPFLFQEPLAESQHGSARVPLGELVPQNVISLSQVAKDFEEIKDSNGD